MVEDDRSNFYFSSSLAPVSSNMNTLYMHNYVRGELQDVGGDSSAVVQVKFFRGLTGPVTGITGSTATGSNGSIVTTLDATCTSQGIYKASFAIAETEMNANEPYFFDVWRIKNKQAPNIIHTGSAIKPKKFNFSNINVTTEYLC